MAQTSVSMALEANWDNNQRGVSVGFVNEADVTPTQEDDLVNDIEYCVDDPPRDNDGELEEETISVRPS